MNHNCSPDLVAQIVRHRLSGRTLTEIRRLTGKPLHIIKAVLAERGRQ